MWQMQGKGGISSVLGIRLRKPCFFQRKKEAMTLANLPDRFRLGHSPQPVQSPKT